MKSPWVNSVCKKTVKSCCHRWRAAPRATRYDLWMATFKWLFALYRERRWVKRTVKTTKHRKCHSCLKNKAQHHLYNFLSAINTLCTRFSSVILGSCARHGLFVAMCIHECDLTTVAMSWEAAVQPTIIHTLIWIRNVEGTAVLKICSH